MFQHSSFRNPEKTPTQSFNVACNIGKDRKMDKNRKIRAMTLSLNKIQSLILHMYIIFEDSNLHSSGENCDINLALKDKKWTNKEEE